MSGSFSLWDDYPEYKPGALPKHSLGNGLDHPWFDRARWVRHVKDDAAKRTGAIETGQSQFHQFWLRAAQVEANAFVQRLLELCPMRSAPESGLYGLKFVTVPRYLARAQPKEDFAYLPWGEAHVLGRRARRAESDFFHVTFPS